MMTLAGEVHDAVLANHCLVADCFAILAICKLNATAVVGSTADRGDWKVAMEHYEFVLKWVKR